MKHLLLRWLASALALFIVTKLVPGIRVTGQDEVITLLITSAALGLVNAFIRPIIMFFVWPINCLTFGLLGFVINVLLFQLTDWLIPSFRIDSLMSAVIGALAVGIITGLLNFFIRDKKQ